MIPRLVILLSHFLDESYCPAILLSTWSFSLFIFYHFFFFLFFSFSLSLVLHTYRVSCHHILTHTSILHNYTLLTVIFIHHQCVHSCKSQHYYNKFLNIFNNNLQTGWPGLTLYPLRQIIIVHQNLTIRIISISTNFPTNLSWNQFKNGFFLKYNIKIIFF